MQNNIIRKQKHYIRFNTQNRNKGAQNRKYDMNLEKKNSPAASQNCRSDINSWVFRLAQFVQSEPLNSNSS